MSTDRNNRPSSELPPGAPARRVKIDFGRSPIRNSAPPCRIVDSEPKLLRRTSVDVGD